MTDIALSSFISSVADLLRGDYKQSRFAMNVLQTRRTHTGDGASWPVLLTIDEAAALLRTTRRAATHLRASHHRT